MTRARIFTCSVLALLITVIASPQASAQFRRGGMNIPPSVMNLFMLRIEAVQKELALDEKQAAAINELAGQMQTEAMEIISGLQDLTPEEQREEMPGIMKMVAERGKEIQEKVDKVLDEKQKARTDELSLQRRGVQALEDDAVIEKLKLSDEQKTKLAAVRDGVAEKQQKIFENAAGDRDKMREGFRKLQAETGEQAMAVLTPEQQQQFEQMKGEKFEFPPQRGLF